MELKVWVEGIQRIVCGVTDKTTCQDVVYALAHATGKTGRFTLIERWRNNERLLAPQEHPLKVLLKWGEYSNDVQFILQRTALGSSEQQSPDSSKVLQELPSPGGGSNKEQQRQQQQKDLKKSLTFSGSHINDSSPFKGKNNIGIVKGVPQAQRKEEDQQMQYYVGQENGKLNSDRIEVVANVRCYGSVDKQNAYNIITPTSPSQMKGWPMDGYDSDQRSRTIDPTSPKKGYDSGGSSPQRPPPYREPPPPGKPPPYRDPPPPPQRLLKMSSPSVSDTDTVSPSNSSHSHTPTSSHTPTNLSYTHGSKSPKVKRNLLKEYKPPNGADIEGEDQHRDLLKIISLQREKLSNQQADISKLDAEICYLENKGREHQHQLEQVTQELRRLDLQGHRNDQEVLELQELEEKAEASRAQERLLQSELLHLQGKLTSCENQLMQCRNTMRVLNEEAAEEKRRIAEQEEEQREREKLERQLAQRQREYQGILTEKEQLSSESTELEQQINSKKEELEILVEELKQANLQSLQITPTEDIRALIEGSGHSKSNRKLVSNPRQLENAVPTSKNPHGVWV